MFDSLGDKFKAAGLNAGELRVKQSVLRNDGTDSLSGPLVPQQTNHSAGVGEMCMERQPHALLAWLRERRLRPRVPPEVCSSRCPHSADASGGV